LVGGGGGINKERGRTNGQKNNFQRGRQIHEPSHKWREEINQREQVVRNSE